MGAKVQFIKCGAPGIYYRTSGRDTLRELCAAHGLDADEWAGKEGFETSFEPPAFRSGTGAGDASIAAFLAAMTKGKSLARSVSLAAGAGACCVSAYDAVSGLVPLDELERRIDAGWPKRGKA